MLIGIWLQLEVINKIRMEARCQEDPKISKHADGRPPIEDNFHETTENAGQILPSTPPNHCNGSINQQQDGSIENGEDSTDWPPPSQKPRMCPLCKLKVIPITEQTLIKGNNNGCNPCTCLLVTICLPIGWVTQSWSDLYVNHKTYDQLILSCISLVLSSCVSVRQWLP